MTPESDRPVSELRPRARRARVPADCTARARLKASMEIFGGLCSDAYGPAFLRNSAKSRLYARARSHSRITLKIQWRTTYARVRYRSRIALKIQRRTTYARARYRSRIALKLQWRPTSYAPARAPP